MHEEHLVEFPRLSLVRGPAEVGVLATRGGSYASLSVRDWRYRQCPRGWVRAERDVFRGPQRHQPAREGRNRRYAGDRGDWFSPGSLRVHMGRAWECAFVEAVRPSSGVNAVGV